MDMYIVLLLAGVVLVVMGCRLAWKRLTVLPALVGELLGLAFHLLLGAWVFRERAWASDGQPLGRVGGTKLTALAMGFLLLTIAVLRGALTRSIRLAYTLE